MLPSYLLWVIVFDILVAIITIGYFVKQRMSKKAKPILVDVEGKVLHRCPKCNSLFEEPSKEIDYFTEPPTEKLVCPKCFTPLRRVQSPSDRVVPRKELKRRRRR
jgi:uncharacterized protein with PIN domain